MATFIAQAISPATFTGIRSRLTDGIGFFVDRSYRYAVVDRGSFELRVVRRMGSIRFSQMVAALPRANRVVINGNYFTGTLLYPRAATGVVDPTSVYSVGDVYQSGVLVEADHPDNQDPTNFFHFGSDRARPLAYVAGTGNAPPTLQDGMGGLGPMILGNPATGLPLRYGIGNRYASASAKTTPPQNEAEWTDCVQRNNNTYASIQRETAASNSGFCVIASSAQEAILLAATKPHGDIGDLDTIRDSLFAAGIDRACFTDGSNSACMATERVFDFRPADYKDNLIEYGFSLFETAVYVDVTFSVLNVIDDLSPSGAGSWDLEGRVNGRLAGGLTGRTVNSGEAVPLGWSLTERVVPGANLEITMGGAGSTGTSTVGLGDVREVYSAASTPPWGMGIQLLTSSNWSYSALVSIVVR